MQQVKRLLMIVLLSGAAHAIEVLVDTQDGRTYAFEVDPEESLDNLQESLSFLMEEDSYIVAVPSKKKYWSSHIINHGEHLGYPRDFYATLKQQEREDIHYIVTSLADKSLITIALMKGDLEEAGNRIDHIHPLRFLMTVFTDEKMKVSIRNIRNRGWIWNQFIDKTKKCLETEMRIGNMQEPHIHQFSQTLKLDKQKVSDWIQREEWDGLIEILIKEIPRQGNQDRYDN